MNNGGECCVPVKGKPGVGWASSCYALRKLAAWGLMLIFFLPGRVFSAAISIHPEHPRALVYRGKPIYLVGDYNWGTVDVHPSAVEAERGLTGYDYRRLFDEMAKRGLNFKREAWVNCWEGRPYLMTRDGRRFVPFDLEKWNEGGWKFDLTKWNPDYWKRLKDVVDYANKKGIIFMLGLFDGDTEDAYAWPRYHGFHRNNNVNGIDADADGDGRAYEYGRIDASAPPSQRRKMRSVLRLQERFVKKVIDTVGMCPNLIYELMNEPGHGAVYGPKERRWHSHIATLVKEYEKGKGFEEHLVAVNGAPVDYLLSEPNIDVACYHRRPTTPATASRFLASVAKLPKPVIYDTDTADHWGPKIARVAWTCFVSGAYFAWLDFHEDNLYPDPIKWGQKDVRIQLANLVKFASRTQWWRMAPHNELVSGTEAYCLASPGEEYVIYLPRGGDLVVRIPRARDSFRAFWYDPARDKLLPGRSVRSGARTKLTPPSPSFRVLHIVTTQVHAPSQ